MKPEFLETQLKKDLVKIIQSQEQKIDELASNLAKSLAKQRQTEDEHERELRLSGSLQASLNRAQSKITRATDVVIALLAINDPTVDVYDDERFRGGQVGEYARTLFYLFKVLNCDGSMEAGACRK